MKSTHLDGQGRDEVTKVGGAYLLGAVIGGHNHAVGDWGNGAYRRFKADLRAD